MSQLKVDKGRVKIGKYSLSNLALAEAGAALAFFILTFVLGWSAFKDMRVYYAWNDALKSFASNQNPTNSLETCINYRPEFAAPYMLDAHVAANTENYSRAEERYTSLFKLDPSSEAAAVGSGILKLRAYDKSKQDNLLGQAKNFFSQASGSADARVGSGHVMLRQGDLEGALKQFETALNMNPPPSLDGMLDLYIGQGAIFVKRNDATRAREAFEKARFLSPTWDRGWANICYLLAKQLAETPAMDREKFRSAKQAWIDFINVMGSMYNQNKDARSYFKDAMVVLFDAFAGLALRSLDLGEAAGKLGNIRGMDKESKRPTLNYLAMLAQVMYNPALTIDERRQYLVEILNTGAGSFSLHHDMGPRERAVVYQIMASAYCAQEGGGDTDQAKKVIDSAIEEFEKSGDDPHLGAMIYRTKVMVYWKGRNFAKSEEEKAKVSDQIHKDGKKSLDFEFQQDLQDFLKGK